MISAKNLSGGTQPEQGINREAMHVYGHELPWSQSMQPRVVRPVAQGPSTFGLANADSSNGGLRGYTMLILIYRPSLAMLGSVRDASFGPLEFRGTWFSLLYESHDG